MDRCILTLSCPDRIGIVAAVAKFATDQECNIVESAQFVDAENHRFFMRVCFVPQAGSSLDDLRHSFSSVGECFSMAWALRDAGIRPRLVILVSRHGHCLNDLLYRFRIGALPVDIPAIVSNHRDFYQLAAANNVPFHYLPVTAANKAQQETSLRRILQEERCELIVLARYMQVLSPQLAADLSGRAINIHHSFLPSFQGANPYQQAHDRGVKLIGATAHYVTQDLDEGPIIEQDVARVDHSMSVAEFAAVGRDVESAVLARAVKWHVEHRVVLSGSRTVVFR